MVKKVNKRNIYVYADWQKDHEPMPMGVLSAELLRGKEVFSFEYDKQWLSSKLAQVLDPDLQMYSGRQFLHDDAKPNFGLFLDSSPDRWGRLLMRRREAIQARLEKRPVKKLFETDYLLGVYDGHRMGGLRFKTDKDGPFLNDNAELASLPWTSIPELEHISLRMEEGDTSDDLEYLKWLNMLIAPGSSLGGSRPKAGVLDKDRNLWIAKFPSIHDGSDMGAWEMVVHQLAVKSGIQMSECRAQKFGSGHHTFLTRRFDRDAEGRRIHFASAMTLLGYTDGQGHTEGVSYLDIVEFITNYSADVRADLEQLWRRMAFSICVSNVDDHLRNHGFLLTPNGWRLSPAFDLNANEVGTGLSLNINQDENDLDLELAYWILPYFRLSKEQADQIVADIKHHVRGWEKLAAEYDIPRRERELKANAFHVAYL